MSRDETGSSRRAVVAMAAAALVAGVAGAATGRPAPAHAATDQETIDRIAEVGVYISAARFSGIDPTGVADSTAGLVAAIETVPAHGTAIVAPGRYLVTGPINGGRTDLRLVGHGATLVQGAAAPVISASAPWGRVHRVTKASLVSEPSNNPGVSDTSLTHKITTATATGFREGDLVKVVSDDGIPEARVPSGGLASRLGEYAVVKRANGTTLYTVGPLREAHATNIRIVAAPRQSFELRGFTLETADGNLAGGGAGPLVNLIGLLRPVVADLKVTRASSTVLNLGGCFGYLVDGLDVSYARNDTTTTPMHLGYAVLDNACAYGVVRHSTMRHVRHAYTDDSPRIAAGSTELWKFGRTYGTKVVDCHSLGAASDAFDTHHASEGVQFIGCSATGGGAGAAGFGLRGKGHAVVDGRVELMDIGIAVFTEGAGGGESVGHRVENAVLHRIAKTALSVQVRPMGHPNANVRQSVSNVRVDGLVVTESRWAVDAMNAHLDLRGCRFAFGAGSSTATVAVLRNRNSSMTVSDADIDMTANTAGGIEHVHSLVTTGQPEPNRTTLRDVTVRHSSSAATRADRFLLGSNHRVRMKDVVFDLPFRVMPGSFDGESLLHWSVVRDSGVARSDLSSAFHYAEGDLSKPQPAVWVSDEPTMLLQLHTGTSAHTVAPFGIGRRRGQQLQLLCTGSGSATIPHGTAQRTRNLGNAALRLTADRFATYVWDGSTWRQSA